MSFCDIFTIVRSLHQCSSRFSSNCGIHSSSRFNCSIRSTCSSSIGRSNNTIESIVIGWMFSILWWINSFFCFFVWTDSWSLFLHQLESSWLESVDSLIIIHVNISWIILESSPCSLLINGIIEIASRLG